MNELYNCISLDSEAAKRITYFAQLCKKIKDKGYTTSQIKQDIQFINEHIALTAGRGETNIFGKCFWVEQGENLHCELEDLYAIFSLYGFKCEFDSVKNSIRIEW